MTATGQPVIPPPEGTLFYVVGAPAEGKHRLLNEARHELAGDPTVLFAHRYVTRPVAADRNDEIELAEVEFLARVRRRLFAMHWEHAAVRYGVGMEINYWLAIGLRVVVKGSRAYLPQALAIYPEMTVLWLGGGGEGNEAAGARLLPDLRPDRDASVPDDRPRGASPVIYLDCTKAPFRARAGLVSVLTAGSVRS